MQLIAWFGLCLVASLVLRRHPFALSLTAIVLWCGVPGVAGHYVTGSSNPLSDLHPAAVLVLTTLGVQLLAGSGPLNRALGQGGGQILALLGVITVAALTGLATTGLTSLTGVINQLVAPAGLFYLIGSSILDRSDHAWRLRITLLVVAFLQSSLSIVQAVLARPLVWTSDYEGQYWFNEDYHRWMGTFDHPLILSLFLSCSIFLLVELRRWWLTLVLLLVFIGGVLVTQSRAGFVVAGVGCVYLLVRARLGSLGKLAFLTLGVITSVLAYQAGVGAPLQDRVVDDTGSTSARQQALDYFGQNWPDFVWSGRGLDSSFTVAAQAGLQTSFESAFLMYSIDIGLIVTLLYFGTILVVIGSGLRAGAVRGSVAAAVAAFVVVQTFSGLSGVTAVAAILWSLLSLAAFTGASRNATGRADLAQAAPTSQPLDLTPR